MVGLQRNLGSCSDPFVIHILAARYLGYHLSSPGDFAVLALALVAASLGALFGPDHPVRWLQTILSLSCVTLVVALMALPAGIAGHAARLSARYDARYSIISLIIAVVVGTTAWWSTSPRPDQGSDADGAEDNAEAPA